MSEEKKVTKKVNGEKKDEKERANYIVGIGASAGGLEAIQKLLHALPPNTGFPFIVVQHLSPDYKSLLGEILGKYTEMPVIQVEDGMEICPNCVYVIQPGKNMRISNGKIVLSAQKEKELNLPIDMLFRSLADEAGAHAIAIVLSGTGSDGTNGIKDVKEQDGMIIVQDYDSSKFDGMPRSAMRTGLVDAQLAPEEIALELQHISNTVSKDSMPFRTEKQIDEDLMKKIYIILKKISNVNFTHYKKSTILRRIERRMMLAHKETLSEYVEYLYDAPDEVKTLSKEVLIGVTNFFRDPEYFQCLQDTAIQDILLHSTEDEPIRAWVAGCSTGEEAYSIAILFCEVMDKLKLHRNVKIFATDLDVSAITTAGKGVYGDSIVDFVSPQRLSRYFTHRNNTYTVNRDIRKMIVFSPHNVFQDPPFGRLDLISCRNMLIYFQPVLQNDLFAIFHASLKDGGFLFLGKSEAIGSYTEAFPVVDVVAKIFTHRSEAKIPGQKTVPYLQTTYLDDDFADDADVGFIRQNPPRDMQKNSDYLIDNQLLEQFMPACLIVNEKNELVHTYGENTNYIHMPVGKFTNSLFDLITEALKIPVSTLLKEAREKHKMVQYKDIQFEGEREKSKINLTAMSIDRRQGESNGLYALIFAESAEKNEVEGAVPYDIDRVASQRITDLEQELGDVQGKLNRSMAEQECVNEELQAANEELLTANEELQSSNEELQSVNEELYTVNSEYQQKLTELADLNDDLANFLSSTLTGIIFVDNKLNIRRYTDYVTTEFSVMDHDIGRSLKFISYHFPTVDIIEICDNVLKTLVPDEREITTSKNKVFFMRVAPYRSTENKILGCVITLMDVTTQKQGQVQLKDTEKRLSIVQQANEEKSDYLSRIAHEIRTPMGALVGLIKMMKQQSESKEMYEENLDKVSETVEYMASIVADISEASRGERGDFTQVAEPFELREILESVSSLVCGRAEDAGIQFEISMPDDLEGKYQGNKTSIQQILINFINNALKYTPKNGEVSLKVYEDEEKACETGMISVCFVISDTGVGIKKDFISEMFKPFTRADGEDRSGNSSMGLGLSIASNLVKSMHGEIDVESEIGVGTTFTIHVQLEKFDGKELPNAKIQEAILEGDLKGCKILVAEDNPLNRKILVALLVSEDMECFEAADGEEAVKMFMESPANTFDCVLMDMRMPKIDGIKATSLIRESGKRDAKSIGIVGVSANGFADDIKKARQAGVDEYTTKPIDRDHLFMAMKLSMSKEK